MPKVSVIVPVYNVEKYLIPCIDSILKQTLSDIEIICVDDGSTDGSGAILDQYQRQDDRVVVLHRANAGYGAAMNAGLAAASGEYIGIVESDDCILPEMYETLYEHAKREQLDVIKSDAFYWLETAGYCERIHYAWLDAYYGRVLTGEERWKYFEFFMNIWTGIYRREFLTEQQIRFHETPGASYQDNGFWLQTLTFCNRVMWLDAAFYLYRQDNPMASVKSTSKIMAMTNEYEYIAELMKERDNKEGLLYCNYYRMFRHRGTFYRIADECKREFCDQIIRDYKVYGDSVRRNARLKAWYDWLCSDPDKACQTVTDTKRAVRERLEQASGIILYGAGIRGHMAYKCIYNEGYYRKLRCFAVSETPERKQIGDKEVLTIREAVKRYPDALAVLAVVRGTNAYQQMKCTVQELGIKEHIDATDMEDCFYIL